MRGRKETKRRSSLRASALAVPLLAVLLSGCLGGGSEGPADETFTFPRGVHPWPAGDEWPEGLEGPFGLKEILHAPLASFDGTVLDGWLLLPDVPADVKVPVVLWTAPYFGQCSYYPPPPLAPVDDYPSCHYAVGTDPALRDTDQVSESVPVDLLLSHGYAVAVYNVRGSGNSGGCFEWFGPNEQRDQAVLVEWLGEQPWSNGRVAMQGLSYHGTTPWEAAIQNPSHLKTIVVAGMVGDAYTFSHTPQGATFAFIPVFSGQFALRVSLSPPLEGGPEHATVDHAPVLPDRACPELAKALSDDALGVAADRRDAAFWDDRRLIDRFPDVEAAVFLTHGFLDLFGSGHQQQENAVWETLAKAPKRMLEGQWGHTMPQFALSPGEWNETLLAWYDFWLKGIGDAPPGLGQVTYQDGAMAWHNTTAWPPAEARPEVLYLSGGDLSAEAGVGTATFHSRPTDWGSDVAWCEDLTDPLELATAPSNLLYLSEPAAEDLLVAGNPFAYLTLSSNLPGGQVALHVYDVGPDAGCGEGLDRWGVGVADLRFHQGNFVGTDFPVGKPATVRVDITNFAEVLPKGHRLGLVVSYGDLLDRVPALGLQPLLTVHEGGGADASQLVVPLVSGTLGGEAPSIHYPPRPFVPLVTGEDST